MKNIKKIMVALMCVLLCVVLFVGCNETKEEPSATPAPSQSTAPTEEMEIVMKPGDVYRIFVWNNIEENWWVDGTHGTRGPEVRQRWLDFQDEHQVTITWVACTDGNNWLNSVLTAAASSEPLADIFHMGGPFAIPTALSTNGTSVGQLYVDMTPYIKYTNLNDGTKWKLDAMQSMGTYNDSLYVAIPYDEGWGAAATNQVCFFNVDLLEENGYTEDAMYEMYQNGTWTFDKFREIALACTKADRNVYGTCMGENVMALLSLICANNGAVVAPDENGTPKFAADSANSMKAINFFLDMCQDDKSVYLEAYQSQNEAVLFKKGEVALMLTYANRVQAGEGPRKGAMYQMDDLNYGIILPPKGPDATDYTSDSNWASPLSIFKGHANEAGVVQCMSLYMCPEFSYDSLENTMLLESEAQIYFPDKRSVQTLKDAIIKTVNTTYMPIWSISNAEGLNLASTTTYNIQSWVEGATTPENDYAARKDALNTLFAEHYNG